MLSIIIYTLSICFTLLLLYFVNKNEFLITIKKNSKLHDFMITILCFIPLILIFSLRENVGTDYSTYETLFYNTIENKSIYMIFNHYIEPGWVFLMYISSFISSNFLFFKFLISIIFSMYLTKIIQNEKLNYQLLMVFLSYVIIFLPFLNITRQMLATIILIYALKRYFEKDYVPSIINFFIASLIHKSAICFAVVPIIHYIYNKNINIKIKHKKINIFKIIEWLLIFSSAYVLPFVMILNSILKALNIECYYIYETLNLSVNFLLYILPIAFIYNYFINYYLSKRESKKGEDYFIYIMFLICILFQSLGSLIMAFERLSIYFFSLSVYLFPSLLKRIHNLKNKDFYILTYGFFIIYFIMMYVILRGQGIFPYKTI